MLSAKVILSVVNSYTVSRDTYILSSLLSVQFDGSDTSEELSMQSVESATKMLSHVTKILTHLTNQRTQHLFLIKGSQRLTVFP